MQIDIEEIPQMTIEEFADANQLVMEVKERPLPVGNKMRYYAGFKNAEVMESGCLVGAHGNGATPEEAIEDYAAEISTKKIAVDAWKPARREIVVPRLVKKKDGAFPERLPGDHFMTRAEVERLMADRDSWRRTAETLQRQLTEAREALRDTWAWIDSLPAKPLPNAPLGKARAKSMAALGEGGGK